MFNSSQYFYTRSLHPLLVTTIALMVGILFAASQDFFIFFMSISILTILFLSTKYNKKYVVLLMLIAFCIGHFRHVLLSRKYHAIHSYLIHNRHDFILTITDIQKTKNSFYSTYLHTKIHKERITGTHQWQNLNAHIIFYTKNISDLAVGDTIKCNNISCISTTNDSYKNYLVKQSIHAISFSKNFVFIRIQRPAFSLRRFISTYKNNLKENILKKMTPKTKLLFSSLFLGNNIEHKKQIKNIKQDFSRWGILHIMARSGLHLMMFIMLLSILFSYIPLSIQYKEIILMICVVIYALLSWQSLSFLRALMMFLWYKIYNIKNIATQTFYIVLLVTCSTLIYNPFALFFLDFQLSFGLTAALAWLFHLQIYKNKLALN